MTTEQKLKLLLDIILQEIDNNHGFKEKIDSLLSSPAHENKKPKSKRNPSLVNPYCLINQGEAVLMDSLRELSVDQLKDVILEHNMDSAKLAMKWKDKTRLMTLIIDMAHRRTSKGNVFMPTGGTSQTSRKEN